MTKAQLMEIVNNRISLLNLTEKAKNLSDSKKVSMVTGVNVDLDNCSESRLESIKYLIPNGVGYNTSKEMVIEEVNEVEPIEEPIVELVDTTLSELTAEVDDDDDQNDEVKDTEGEDESIITEDEE